MLTSGTLIDGARIYAAAADAINDRYPNALHVLSHNLGIAIELALKSFLVHHGLGERDLRRFGHDLSALFNEATRLGLTHTGSRNFRLNVLGVNYEKRIFAYPADGNLASIMPWSLRQVAHEIICEVFEAVKGSTVFEELKGEPGLAILSHYPEDLNPSHWASPPEKPSR
jgi:hypothetical protein